MRWRVWVVALWVLAGTMACGGAPAQPAKKKPAHTSAKPGGGKAHASRSAAARHASTGHGTAKGRSAAVRNPQPTVETRRLSAAFTASAQLRPMAQQLIASRSPAAYNGVIAYAASHPGEGAAAADLAVGHARMLDRSYGEAETAFLQASRQGSSLADYADYLGAEAAVQGNRPADAYPLLDRFTERHPGSLFIPNVPILLANAYLAAKDPGGAMRTLSPYTGTPQAGHSDFRALLAKAYQVSGDTQHAADLYRKIYLEDPLSSQAADARTQLEAMNTPLSPGERKQHADAMFNAKHYEIAAGEYRALAKSGGLSPADLDALKIYAAVCDLRLKIFSVRDLEQLPVTNDDTAALKLYMQSELARKEGLTDAHDTIVKQLLQSYPGSRWLEEALYSGGNMYLIKRDPNHAIDDYVALTQHFPRSTYAPSAHWHAAWLCYRLHRYPDAARLMDEQIVNYPGGTEIPGALYWRGRLYEDVERNFSQAANYYQALNAAYVNSYYAMLGRQRLAVIGKQVSVDPAPALAAVHPVNDPHLTAALPENDPHLIKARLLANAALNEYIRPEIQLSSTSDQWGALAEAEIYESSGENTRALQAMKRSKIPFLSLPVSEVPNVYWQLVFPRPYWGDLTANAHANGLDPYLVAALIRQESEFNPGAVSPKKAYGLMQLLPSVGKSLAKKEGNRKLTATDLLNPSTNIQLGTIDLRKSIDRYNGVIEYALASYNAGDTPVHQWISVNDYKDLPEWVESIPYTETRDYVQAIMRNRELYKAIYGGN